MTKNWRVYKALSYVVLAFLAAGILGFGGINIGEKAFGFIDWKFLLVGGVGYLAWFIKSLLNF